MNEIGAILSDVKHIKNMLSGVEHTIDYTHTVVDNTYNELLHDVGTFGSDFKTIEDDVGGLPSDLQHVKDTLKGVEHTTDLTLKGVEQTYNEGATTLKHLAELTKGQTTILSAAQSAYNESLSASKDLGSLEAGMSSLTTSVNAVTKKMAAYDGDILDMKKDLASLSAIKDAIVTGAASFAQMKTFVDHELPKMKTTMDSVVKQSTSVFGDMQSADTLVGSFSRDLQSGDSTLKTMLQGISDGTKSVGDLDSALKGGLVDAQELASVIVNAKADATSLAIAIKTSEKVVAGIAASAHGISDMMSTLSDTVAQVEGDLKGVVLQAGDVARLAGIAAKALKAMPDEEQKIVGEMKDAVDNIRRATRSVAAMEEEAKTFMVTLQSDAKEIRTAAGQLEKLPGQLVKGFMGLVKPIEEIAPLMLLGFGVLGALEIVNFIK